MSDFTVSKNMKCLLCGQVFENKQQLADHCINFHKVDAENRFFQKLITCDTNECIFKKCLRLQEFLPTSQYKIKHDFLRHYNLGKEDLFEDKPLDITENQYFIQYSINFRKHSDYYDFFNSEKVVYEFLSNVRSKFKPNNSVIIKGSFILENIQPSDSGDFIDLRDSRYWSTDVYKATYFNDFIFFSIQNDYLKRVINNGLSGSSWVFNRFVVLDLTVLKNQEDIVI